MKIIAYFVDKISKTADRRMAVLPSGSNFSQKIFTARPGNVYDAGRFVHAQKFGHFAQIAVEGALGYAVFPAKFFAGNRFAPDEHIVQEQYQFDFHLSATSQADGAVIWPMFWGRSSPLQRLHYSILFRFFVQPRSRICTRYRLNLPRFRLRRPFERKNGRENPPFSLFCFPSAPPRAAARTRSAAGS